MTDCNSTARRADSNVPSGVPPAQRRFRAVVFKEAPPSADFSRSEQIVLPGEHTELEAWAAVLRALDDPGYIGGHVRPCMGAQSSS